MLNLLQSICVLSKDRKYYYPELYSHFNTREKQIFQDERNAFDFINTYYKYGQKESIKSSMDNKNLHTASLYFIGCLLQDLLNIHLKKIKDYYYKKEDNYFTFLWFLITLYHDMLSMEEKISKPIFVIPKNQQTSKRAECLFNKIIKYKKLDVNYVNEFLSFLNKKPKIFKNLYSVKLIKLYLLYRYEQMNSLDHGILAGLVLYDKLRKNYDSKKIYSRVFNKNTVYENFTYNDRIFSRKDFSLYAEAAKEIVYHNIFKPKDIESLKLYEEYNLSDLNNNNKISVKDNPLSFLLGLIDTIEPIKNVEKSINNLQLPTINYIDILSSISVSIIKPNQISIKFLKLEKKYWQYLSKNIVEMKKWLKIEVNAKPYGYILKF